MIPKIIHQIWIGEREVPVYVDTWKALNTDFDYILWDNEKVKELFPLYNQHLYDLYDNETVNVEAGRSDLLRIEILYKFGGIYIDADCECLRPLEGDFLQSDFFAVYENEEIKPGLVANGVIGSIPGHDILVKYINWLNKHRQIHHPVWVFSGPQCFTDILQDYQITLLPSYYFYPWWHGQNSIEDYKGDFKPFSDHHWANTRNTYI